LQPGLQHGLFGRRNLDAGLVIDQGAEALELLLTHGVQGWVYI
jgi:hypothetical protein